MIKEMTKICNKEFTNVVGLAPFENIVYAAHTYFSKSSKRLKNYNQIALRRQTTSSMHRENIANDITVIKSLKPALRPVKTRWCSFRPAVDRILRNWDTLAEFFQNETSELKNTAARTLSQHISQSTMHGAITKAIFKFVACVLVHFERAEKIFQSEEISIAEAESVLFDLTTKLAEFRESIPAHPDLFSHINAQAHLSSKMALKQCFMVAGIDTAVKYLQKWGQLNGEDALAADGYSLRFLAAHVFSIIGKRDGDHLPIYAVEFGFASALASRYGLGRTSEDDFRKECDALAGILRNKIGVEKLQRMTLSAVWQEVFKCDIKNELPFFLQLASFVLSAPASSASAERVFSMMNFHHKKERSSLSTQHLKNELFIKMNLRHIDLVNFGRWAAPQKDMLKEVGSDKKYAKLDQAVALQTDSEDSDTSDEDIDDIVRGMFNNV